MIPSDFIKDLVDHKRRVAGHMQTVANELFRRATIHDNSKFSPEEFDAYNEAFPNLQKYAYGSGEFKAELQKIQPAIQHHYQENNHHPEYYENGINDMSLIDLIEMICDWMAASERSKTNLLKGLKINQERFGIDDQLTRVLEHTVDEIQNKGTRPAKGSIDYPDMLF